MGVKDNNTNKNHRKSFFYYYGIVPAAGYFVFLFSAFGRAVKRKDKFGCLVLAVFSIYLFTESLYFSNYLTRDFMLMAAAGTGAYPSLEEGIRRAVKVEEEFYPDDRMHEYYMEKFEKYIVFYDKMYDFK